MLSIETLDIEIYTFVTVNVIFFNEYYNLKDSPASARL